MSLITDFWDCFLLLSYYYKKDTFRDLDSGILLENSVGTWLGRMNNSFRLLSNESLYLDVDFFYLSPTVNGNSRRDAFNYLDILLRKTIWNKKGSISMGVRDIFNQGNYFTTRTFLNQNNSTFSRFENRLFTFAFRYKFGNTGIKDNKKRKRVDERNRI